MCTEYIFVRLTEFANNFLPSNIIIYAKFQVIPPLILCLTIVLIQAKLIKLKFKV